MLFYCDMSSDSVSVKEGWVNFCRTKLKDESVSGSTGDMLKEAMEASGVDALGESASGEEELVNALPNTDNSETSNDPMLSSETSAIVKPVSRVQVSAGTASTSGVMVLPVSGIVTRVSDSRPLLTISRAGIQQRAGSTITSLSSASKTPVTISIRRAQGGQQVSRGRERETH